MHVDGDETKTPETDPLPFNLKIETTPTEQVSKQRILGVTVDKQLKWQTHINNICRIVSRKKIFFRNSAKLSAKNQNQPSSLLTLCHI